MLYMIRLLFRSGVADSCITSLHESIDTFIIYIEGNVRKGVIIKGKKVIILTALLCVTAIAGIIHMTGYLWTGSKGVSSIKKADIVLDPGHGGSDPGKVGVNDALEKDINLTIAKKVSKLLKKKGVKVVLTRDSDDILKPGESYGKMKDLNLRLEYIKAAAPKMVVGIHQNSFTDPEVHGAQVFFDRKSEEAGGAAEIMQKALLAVDPENTRVAKSDQNYYMLAKSSAPTIIVECGFLSNPEEAERLVEKEYQNEIAKAICQGILDYMEGTQSADSPESADEQESE